MFFHVWFRLFELAVSLVARRFLMYVALVLLCGQAHTQTVPLRVVYTGKLFGYFRIEAGNPPAILHPVEQFFQEGSAEGKNTADSRPLLLGMGDNFSPEMGAALQLAKPASSPCLPPKSAPPIPVSLYKSDCRFAASAEEDNVANFLLRAGYRAIVPGREDFIYSAVWLSRTATLLRNNGLEGPPHITSSNRDHRLTMLAGNLRVTFSRYPKKAAQKYPSGAQFCPLLFARELLSETVETCLNGETPTTFDWLSRVDRALQRQTDQPGARIVRLTTDPYASVHRSEVLRTRATLLENEGQAITSMLPRTIGASFRTPLKQLIDADASLAAVDEVAPDISTKRLAQACAALSFSKALGMGPIADKCSGTLTGVKEQINKLLRSAVKCPLGFGEWENDVCNYTAAVVLKHLDEAQFYEDQAQKSYHDIHTSPLLDNESLRAGQHALLWSIADKEFDIGYTEGIVTDNGQIGGTALIVGVVGKETMNAVSTENKEVCVTVSGATGAVIDQAPVGCSKSDVQVGEDQVQGAVSVLDPVKSIRAIIRAAEFVHRRHNQNQGYQYRILMAQMPRTEAEELVVHLGPSAGAQEDSPAQLDMVLSEAQAEHATPPIAVRYGRTEGGRWSATPVFTPLPAYNYSKHNLVLSDSVATIETVGLTRKAINTPPKGFDIGELGDSALHLLAEQLDRHRVTYGVDENHSPYAKERCAPGQQTEEACRVAMIQFLLRRMQTDAHTDAAMLERRDIFLGMLPGGYTGYEMCDAAPPTAIQDCRLRVALDRVLWEGDDIVRVMLSGKDLANLMVTAGNLASQESTLQAQDIGQQWLVTFGVVTKPASNLTRLGVRSNEFSVEQDPECTDAQEELHPLAGGTVMYCVNGLPILSDHAYYIVTSDTLAEDKSAYTAISALPTDYRETATTFLTTKIADDILHRPGESESLTAFESEAIQQKRGILGIDIGKVVLGFSDRKPQGGDSYVAQAFQGATDSRASSPYQSEIDLEAKGRVTWARLGFFSVGTQSDLEFDRSVQGNLLGNPVNAAYPLNNFGIGGFAQLNLHLHPTRLRPETENHDLSVGQTKLVLAPFQYQRQIVGSYLFFPFSPPSKQELTLHLPVVNGFAHRVGLRWEAASTKKWYQWDRGTYIEAGPELAIQNDVLSAVTLSTSGQSVLVCPATVTETIGNCIKNAQYPVNGTTTATSTTETLHTPGLYWDTHFQKGITQLSDKSGPGISLVIETKGDAFFRRGIGKTLSTQTLYAVPLNVGLTFPVLRNLSLAPTYAPFFYGSQLSAQHLWVNTFGINARWYFDRDAAVRRLHQLTFKGPASADETKTAKMK